ncbi:MAG: hypothetical protein RMA76_26910 [Deltaproteobacteria bacterium]
MPSSGSFYQDVLEALSRAKVRFVIVGGVAVNLQGVPRFTADLDVAVALDAENLRIVAMAMDELGLVARLPGSLDLLADPDTVRSWIDERNLKAYTFQDSNNPLRQVDLLLDMPLTLEELEHDADVITAGGVVARVASIESLIRMKSGTGRAQDASDVEALRRIQELEDGP